MHQAKIYYHSDGKIYVNFFDCFYRVTAINGRTPEDGANCYHQSGIFSGKDFSCGTEKYPTKLKEVQQ